MKYLTLLSLPLIFLSGCSTSYQSKSFSGGYLETQLDENVYKVYFHGNRHTGIERVADFTLLRSAQLTLEKGYKYFLVVDTDSYTSNSTYTTPAVSYNSGSPIYGHSAPNTTASQTHNISQPSSSNIIACFKEKPKNGDSYNAEITFKNITEKYGIEH